MACPSDPVGEEQLGVRQVIVDDLADTLNIQAAGGYVGCHQDRRYTGTEVLHHPLARVLTKIPLERPYRVAQRVQLRGQLLHPALCFAKDDNRRVVPFVQQGTEGANLFVLLDGIDQMLYGRQRL